MKRVQLSILCVLCPLLFFPQGYNCNPDPNGEPCMAGGSPSVISVDHQQLIDDIPEMILHPLNNNRGSSVYNWHFSNIYMPVIMNQNPTLMCSQASIVYYVFTYEINWNRKTNANTDAHTFHPSFTYNFVNGGIPSDLSTFEEGIDILKEFGCPDLHTYSQSTGSTAIPTPDPTEWMTGYDEYETALQCRVTQEEKINIRYNLETLKYWLYNHNIPGEGIGGIGSVMFRDMTGVQRLPFGGGSNLSYISSVVPNTIDDGHAMTIVGYDDFLQCGPHTGALILANSYGSTYPYPANAGYEYLPYSLINAPGMLVHDNQDNIWVYVLHVESQHHTDYLLNVEFIHNKRPLIKLGAGHHTSIGNISPLPQTGAPFCYNSLVTAGYYPVLGSGRDDEPIKITLDYDLYIQDEQLNDEEIKEFFFGAYLASGWDASNFLQELSITDNRCEQPLTLYYDVQLPLTINYGQWNWFGIDYPRLDEIYNSQGVTTINDDNYCHCRTIIDNGTTLKIANQKELLFHNGIIEILQGCTLDLGNCNIILKEGINKIIVYGNLTFSGNPTFTTEGGSLEIEYHNNAFPPISHTLNGGNFWFSSINPLKITGEVESLTIDQSLIQNAIIDIVGNLNIQNLNIESSDIMIDLKGGDLSVINNPKLTNTYISAFSPDLETNAVIIENNNFYNTNPTYRNAVIDINDYNNFIITDNYVSTDFSHGIDLFYAGNGTDNDKMIANNTISIYDPNGTIQQGSYRGIDLFFSSAEINENNISKNDYGVVAFSKSQMEIMGVHSSIQQAFTDNQIHCYFSYSSYPEDIRYNYFMHTYTDPYVKLVYDDMNEPNPPIDVSYTWDIRCNCWDSGFDPEIDLVPNGEYDYYPYWTPGQYCVKEQSEAGELFEQAQIYIDTGNYSLADSSFKVLINDYPSDPYAVQSLKQLYRLEEVNGKDYNNLKTYYKGVISLNQDSILCQSSDWMSMHCLIKMDSTQAAINWLDSTIAVPQNTVDSIFAIINLGYIYNHIPDTTLKSVYYTKHNEHIPQSFNQYKQRREELIQELLRSSEHKKIIENTDNHKAAIIKSIRPNPNNGTFDLEIESYQEGLLEVEIYNSLGVKVQYAQLEEQDAPNNLNLRIILNNQTPGVYYIVLKHNSLRQDTRKSIKL